MVDYVQMRGPSPSGPGLRPLAPRERVRVLNRLRRRWPPGDRDWWHPYEAFPEGSDALCLQSSWLVHSLPRSEFRQRASFHWSSYWAIGEGAPRWDDPSGSYQGEFELSGGYVLPVLAGEMLATPRNLSWLAYTDHNEATYLTGAWLVKTVKDLWPAWDEHLWTSPFYEHPPRGAADDRPWWER